MVSETDEKDGESLISVVRLRQPYTPVNSQLCAISGSKAAEICCSADEGLIFPGLNH